MNGARWIGMLALAVLAGCGSGAGVSPSPPTAAAEPDEAHGIYGSVLTETVCAEAGAGTATIAEAGVLERRARLCALPSRERAGRLVPADGAAAFERLLLLSCDPYAHRQALAQALQAANGRAAEWSDEQRAFVAVLRAGQQAMETLESQRQSLEQRLEETIRGIKNIEEAIDARAVNGDGEGGRGSTGAGEVVPGVW